MNTNKYKCPACGGDGIETCYNPDHGFITAVGGEIGRLGCPCCGHDENHKMNGACPECSGGGVVSSEEWNKIAVEYGIDYPIDDDLINN